VFKIIAGMRSRLSFFLPCFMLCLFSCKKTPVTYDFVMSTGSMAFQVPAGDDDSLEVLTAPVNMDSILRSHLRTHIDKVGSVKAYLISTHMKQADAVPGLDWSFFEQVTVSVLDDFRYPYTLSAANHISDTAVRHLALKTVNENNMSSLFVNREGVLFRCMLKPGKPIPAAMACELELLYKVSIIELTD
jgi:hypothetical protein